ncbi:hypothetical protein [Aquabacter cavernae]|uniref:hypothetical protein n=1 Tax=Aquabacter cavernae TaxID=2496029 RepID=UPI000F8D4DAB|nr:hypothetical protein [Aquabacter cavernae]
MSRPPLPIVTDHAVLREVERVHGIDVEAVRLHIAHRVRHAVAAGAAGLISEGHRYIFRGGKVVTVLPGERSSDAEARQMEADRD